jgi:hypothetical protein
VGGPRTSFELSMATIRHELVLSVPTTVAAIQEYSRTTSYIGPTSTYSASTIRECSPTDSWITTVYQPGRSTKLKHIRLTHTMKLGRRYVVHYQVSAKLRGQLDHDKTLNRFVVERIVSKFVDRAHTPHAQDVPLMSVLFQLL